MDLQSPRRIEIDETKIIKKSADVSDLFIADPSFQKPAFPGQNAPAWEPDIMKADKSWGKDLLNPGVLSPQEREEGEQ